MRRFFFWFGVVAAVAIVAAIIGGVVLMQKGQALDAESKAYAETAVRAISSKWDQQELLNRASPELLATVKPDAMTAVFDRFSQYGPLTDYESATGQSFMANFNGITKITAEYKGKARFQNGEATFDIALIKLKGQWLIYGFHIDPVGDWPTKKLEHT